jgi:hypothetical protein
MNKKLDEHIIKNVMLVSKVILVLITSKLLSYKNEFNGLWVGER